MTERTCLVMCLILRRKYSCSLNRCHLFTAR